MGDAEFVVPEYPLQKEALSLTKPYSATTTEAPRFLAVQTPIKEDMKMSELKEDQSVSVESPSEKDADTFDATAWRSHLQEKLYDRNQEQATLRRCFDVLKRTSHGPMLLLISGPSGVGKTRLSQTLRDPVQDQGGYFLSGKFDQLCRPEPYTAFVSAFMEFTNMVVDRGESVRLEMREAILEAVGDEVSVLTDMIPSLEAIVGHKVINNTKAKADDAIQRFVFVFRMFMRSICSSEKPMVLLLDDLQFADPCSLDLLGSLVTDTSNEGLVLVGTCSDRVQQESYLSTKLRDMEDKDNVEIVNVSLSNLSIATVTSLVGNAFDLKTDQKEVLGMDVMRKTHGNIFYVIEYLRWLQDQGLLFFSFDTQSWTFDNEAISRRTSDSDGDFLVHKLEPLSQEVKDVLKVAACLGSYIDVDLVECVLKIPIANHLKDAAGKGFIRYDELRGCYAFEHDVMQEFAYHLIPAIELELFHLEIGRRLWRSLDEDADLDRYIFVVLSQMSIGRRLITKHIEKTAIATLCLLAGMKAAKASTFRTASVYLNFGIELLGPSSWTDDYELSLALHNAAAEMEMCIANFERMDELLDEVLLRAQSGRDRVQAYATRIYVLGVADKQGEAIDTGIMVLKILGEKFPSNLCLVNLLAEAWTVKRMLRGKSDEQLLRLPTSDNEEKLAALQILQLIFLNAVLTRPKFAAFVALRMMKLTLQYGLSVFSSTAFTYFGMLCIGALHDIDAGFRFGQLGMVLLDRFEAMEYLPRVYAAFYGVIHAWKKPIQGSFEPLLHAYRIGLQTGDTEFATLCANIYCFNAFDSGTPLHVIDQEWSGFQDVMQSNRQKAFLRMSLPVVQSIHHYMGLTDDPLSAKGDLVDYDALLQYAVENDKTVNVLGIRCCRSMLAYIFNDYDEAAKMCIDAADLWHLPATFETALFRLLASMVALEMARQRRKYRKNMKTARRCIKIFKKWATASPHNFSDKLFLVEAEMASVRGRNAKAYEKYVHAIALAKDSGFLLIRALSNERAARHLCALGEVAEAEPFFREACSVYGEWGGKRKVERLQTEIDSMYDSIDDDDS